MMSGLSGWGQYPCHTSDLLEPCLPAELDRLVMATGGPIYQAKDACQSPAIFEADYPSLGAFRAIRREAGVEGRITSCLSARLGI